MTRPPERPTTPPISRGAAAAVAIALGAGVFAVSAAAQSGPGPVLHQDLKAPADEARRTARRMATRQPVFGPQPVEGQNPSAIGSGEKILPEPPNSEKPNQEEAIHGAGGFAADRMTDYRPDLATNADGTLHYVEVFNPASVPFKRMSSLDAVRPDLTLTSARGALSDLRVGGQGAPEDDLFWGSLMIELTTGTDVPIPSISPQMKILSYEVTPSVPLVFSKDGADNYFVRSEEPGLNRSQRRVRFLAAGDARYFAPQLTTRRRVRDIDSPVPVRQMPADVRASAERAISVLGLNRNMRVTRAIQILVGYFRSFEAKTPPPTSGNIFWDLFESQAGVCRHRSFAFMIVANALGIPTRYVANEAHAWVEVWIPDNGWARIDLGGAALRLDVDNASGSSMYQPRGRDPFVQPPAYADNYTQLEGDISGLTQGQIQEARTPSGDGPATPGGFGPDRDGDSVPDGAPAPGDDAADQDGTLTGPGQNLPEIPADQLEGKQPTAIVVLAASRTGFRGETITVEGTLTDDAGNGLSGQHINVFLAPAGQFGDDSILVGQTVSSESGEWSAAAVIPVDLALADWEVYASSRGDATYQPSVSE